MFKNGLLLAATFLLICSACSDTNNNRSPLMTMENIQPAHQKPSKVQFIFSLRDQDGHSILIPQEEFDSTVEISIWEDNVPIDYTESHGFIHTSSNFDMDIVLLLDFTASMASAENGIATMVAGAKSLIDRMGETHRIAVMEFHNNDRINNDMYSVIQPFTSDKIIAKVAIDNFVNVGTYHGFSTCWDAIAEGITLFPSSDDPNKIRALAFLSDGFDNSSIATTSDIIHDAIDKDIRLYNIGVGVVSTTNENILKNIANSTGGNYYSARDIDELDVNFNRLVNDLGGNYKISYITPKSERFRAQIQVTYQGVSTSPYSDWVDGDLILGSDKDGVLGFNLSSLENESITFYIRAEHTPRNVKKFRFRVNTLKPVSVELVPKADGGLLEDWTDPTVDVGAYFVTDGAELDFGDFGNLFKVTIGNITETNLVIPIKFDNSVYQYGVRFYGADTTELDMEGNWNSFITIGN
ncbi:MAG: vWA domain-containing protein [Candidatus Zixiibacteriota bacterium]